MNKLKNRAELKLAPAEPVIAEPVSASTPATSLVLLGLLAGATGWLLSSSTKEEPAVVTEPIEPIWSESVLDADGYESRWLVQEKTELRTATYREYKIMSDHGTLPLIVKFDLDEDNDVAMSYYCQDEYEWHTEYIMHNSRHADWEAQIPDLTDHLSFTSASDVIAHKLDAYLAEMMWNKDWGEWTTPDAWIDHSANYTSKFKAAVQESEYCTIKMNGLETVYRFDIVDAYPKDMTFSVRFMDETQTAFDKALLVKTCIRDGQTDGIRIKNSRFGSPWNEWQNFDSDTLSKLVSDKIGTTINQDDLEVFCNALTDFYTCENAMRKQKEKETAPLLPTFIQQESNIGNLAETDTVRWVKYAGNQLSTKVAVAVDFGTDGSFRAWGLKYIPGDREAFLINAKHWIKKNWTEYSTSSNKEHQFAILDKYAELIVDDLISQTTIVKANTVKSTQFDSAVFLDSTVGNIRIIGHFRKNNDGTWALVARNNKGEETQTVFNNVLEQSLPHLLASQLTNNKVTLTHQNLWAREARKAIEAYVIPVSKPTATFTVKKSDEYKITVNTLGGETLNWDLKAWRNEEGKIQLDYVNLVLDDNDQTAIKQVVDHLNKTAGNTWRANGQLVAETLIPSLRNIYPPIPPLVFNASKVVVGLTANLDNNSLGFYRPKLQIDGSVRCQNGARDNLHFTDEEDVEKYILIYFGKQRLWKLYVKYYANQIFNELKRVAMPAESTPS